LKPEHTVKTFWQWLIEKYGYREARIRYEKWKKIKP